MNEKQFFFDQLLENLVDRENVVKNMITVKVIEKGEMTEAERPFVRMAIADSSTAKQLVCYSADLNAKLVIGRGFIKDFTYRNRVVMINKASHIFRYIFYIL